MRKAMLIDLFVFNSLWLLLFWAIAAHQQQQRHPYSLVEMAGWIIVFFVSWWAFRESHHEDTH